MNLSNRSNKKFFEQVKKVRSLQREFFKNKNNPQLKSKYLNDSKKEEQVLDKMIIQIEKLNEHNNS